MAQHHADFGPSERNPRWPPLIHGKVLSGYLRSQFFRDSFQTLLTSYSSLNLNTPKFEFGDISTKFKMAAKPLKLWSLKISTKKWFPEIEDRNLLGIPLKPYLTLN